MKNACLVKVAILFLITSTLSGCIWAIEDDGYRGNTHDRGRGEHRDDNRGRH
jgi:hypothetical protein